MTKTQRKEAFRRIGRAISQKDLLRGYDGFYEFEIEGVGPRFTRVRVDPARIGGDKTLRLVAGKQK